MCITFGTLWCQESHVIHGPFTGLDWIFSTVPNNLKYLWIYFSLIFDPTFIWFTTTLHPVPSSLKEYDPKYIHVLRFLGWTGAIRPVMRRIWNTSPEALLPQAKQKGGQELNWAVSFMLEVFPGTLWCLQRTDLSRAVILLSYHVHLLAPSFIKK